MENTNNSFAGHPHSQSRVGKGSGHQITRDVTAVELQNGDASSSSHPDPLLFVNAYEWSDNNLPIGMSFDSDYRIPTPDFMRGWTYQPPEEKQETNQVSAQPTPPGLVEDFVGQAVTL
ncbi:hypothetical protein Hte_005931 [Hypoxylon texense]